MIRAELAIRRATSRRCSSTGRRGTTPSAATTISAWCSYNGGSFYIDEGKPLPGAIEATVRNLREIAPTIYFNVPKGFEMLLPYLRSDAALRAELLQPAQGAVLRRRRAASSTSGTNCSSWRSRPPASASSSCPASARPRPRRPRSPAPGRAEQPGNIGLPMPGVELKLVPNDGKLEARLQGPQHHAGLLAAARSHRARPSTTRAIYKIGDALKFVDPADPGQGPAVRRPHRRGLQARDRHLGQRRRAARAVRRSLRAAGARRGDRRRRPRRHRGAGVPRHRGLPQARRALPPTRRPPRCSPTPSCATSSAAGSTALAQQSTGSSTRICRLILMAEPPSLDAGEATDKGSINQRAVLTPPRRAGGGALCRRTPSARRDRRSTERN